MKKLLKPAIDFLMLAILTYLANRTNGMGLLLHAWLGIAVFALFVAHHALNFNWAKSLRKGKYTARRIALTATNALLTLAMLLMVLSSALISGLVFPLDFLPVHFVWRNVHTASSAWLFMLSAFHLSFHTRGLVLKLAAKLPRPVFALCSLAVIVAGIFAFTQSRVASNLFLLYTDASLRYPDTAQIAFSVLTVLALCTAMGVKGGPRQERY